MKLNKSRGDMYNGVCTTNPIAGRCEHGCLYCYVLDFKISMLKEKYSGEIRLDKSVLTGNTGSGNTIFVCSCNDMFQDGVRGEDISKILMECRHYPDNTYLFQSKNPRRIIDFLGEMPPKSIFGTTIETDTSHQPYLNNYTEAPTLVERISGMMDMRLRILREFPEDGRTWQRMVSIEPIMDFDVKELVQTIYWIQPDYVSIGANTSETTQVSEPSAQKVIKLVENLRNITEVRLKPNLKRIVGDRTVLDG